MKDLIEEVKASLRKGDLLSTKRRNTHAKKR